MTNLSDACFRFDDISVDPRNFKVLKGDTELAIEPKALLLLAWLIENRDRLVEKRELLDVIWKDVAVTENALTREIGKLRKLLGDDPKSPKYIQTVHTRGYRFIGTVQEPERDPEPETNRPAPAVSEVPRLNPPPRYLSYLYSKQVLAVLCLLIAGTILARRPAEGTRKWPSANGAGPTKLAVLPFRSLRSGADDRDFGLGIADALITRLSNIGQLRVEPVSTVLHYADPKRDSLAIGRDMGVDYVLEGKFQKQGDRTRFTVQLLCIPCDGRAQWAGSFDETSGDIFTVQDSISQKVVSSLPLEVTRTEQKMVARRETSSVAAQLALAKARYFLSSEDTKEGVASAIQNGEAAVRSDPSSASAWSLLSDSYRRQEWYGTAPASFLNLARNAAEKSVRLDDGDIYGHSMLGLIAFQYDWDFAKAEREYARARQIQPGWTHQWYARYLLTRHRIAEAESEYLRFERASRYSVSGMANFAEFLYLTGQYPRALEKIQRTLELRPDYAPAHELLGLVDEQEGLPDAATEFQKAIDFSHGYRGLASLGHLYAKAGQTAKVTQIQQQLEEQRKQRYVAPLELALVHTGSHETAKAMHDLEQAYKDRSRSSQSLLYDPRLADLRESPAGRAFVKRIGLD